MIQYAGAARNASPLISQLLSENIYLQFCNKESFAAFRLREGQDTARIFNFMPVFKCMKTVDRRRAPQDIIISLCPAAPIHPLENRCR